MTDSGSDGKYARPGKVCDVVMKGGITSGVVYPLTLTTLAEEYRFACIGGTSAGAVAAAAAAAAEYGRHIKGAGFERLERVPDEMGSNLLSLFQPTPALKPLFDVFLSALRSETPTGRAAAVILAAIRGFWGAALLGALVGLFIVAIAWAFRDGFGIAFGLLVALVGLTAAIGWRLLKLVKVDLVTADFGLCPGIRQSPSSPEGFTDWLARLIDEAAGRTVGDKPLTFGDLANRPDGKIGLAMMTTSLMEKRPYTLPMEHHGHPSPVEDHGHPSRMEDRGNPLPKEDHSPFVFEKSEWAKLFPERIMNYLVAECKPFSQASEDGAKYYYFPSRSQLPLVVGARMSLSFPGLISAVPLWRRDFTLATDDEKNKLRRCLFSDGGLSSNFPIHFFDRMLPGRPTFAISLDEYDEKRNQHGSVWLPKSAGSGVEIPIIPFQGVIGFLMRLVDSAKDWQDNLQGTLPGYRERIAHVVLKPEEGGLNLAMDQKTIERLAGYGQEAGEILRSEFDLDQHKWRRFLVAMARMEETLDDIATAYKGGQDGSEAFAKFLDRHAKFLASLASHANHSGSYRQSAAIMNLLLVRGQELASRGADWRTRPKIRDGHIPRPPTDLRISPKP
jgi:predicted acylesterase/phospholipase RssA